MSSSAFAGKETCTIDILVHLPVQKLSSFTSANAVVSERKHMPAELRGRLSFPQTDDEANLGYIGPALFLAR